MRYTSFSTSVLYSAMVTVGLGMRSVSASAAG